MFVPRDGVRKIGIFGFEGFDMRRFAIRKTLLGCGLSNGLGIRKNCEWWEKIGG
jgi:hypothetical protein